MTGGVIKVSTWFIQEGGVVIAALWTDVILIVPMNSGWVDCGLGYWPILYFGRRTGWNSRTRMPVGVIWSHIGPSIP